MKWKFLLACWSVAFLCLCMCVCLFASCRSQYKLHTQVDTMSGDKMVRCSRSWVYRSRSHSIDHRNLLHSTAGEPLNKSGSKLTQILITLIIWHNDPRRHYTCTEWSRKNCTKFNAPSFCNRLQQHHVVFTKMPRVYQSLQKFYQLVKYSLTNSRNWIHVLSDVTLHVNMTPLTVEDRLLIKTAQTDKTLDCWKMITEFTAKQWKWQLLFDLVEWLSPLASLKDCVERSKSFGVITWAWITGNGRGTNPPQNLE